MDLSSACAFVTVASDNFSRYPIETQRSLLGDIFELADECRNEEVAQIGSGLLPNSHPACG